MRKKTITRKIIQKIKRGIGAEIKKIMRNLLNQSNTLKILQKKEIELQMREEKINEKLRLLKEELLKDKKTLLTNMKNLERERMEFKNYQKEKILEIEEKSRLAGNKLREIEKMKNEEQKILNIIQKEREELEQKKREFRNYVGNKQLEISLERVKLEREKERFEKEKRNWLEKRKNKVRKIPVRKAKPILIEVKEQTIKEEKIDEPITKDLFEENEEIVEYFDDNRAIVKKVEKTERYEEIEKIKFDDEEIKFDGTKWIPIPFDIED